MRLVSIFLLFIFFNYSFGQDLPSSVFKYEYKRKVHFRYQKEIIKNDIDEYLFGERVIYVENKNSELLTKLIESGVFNPDEIFGKELVKVDTIKKSSDGYSITIEKFDTISVCCLKELGILNPDIKTKRFIFLVAVSDVVNPYEFYFELYNENATKETTIEEFIQNSKMTFSYNAGLMF
ncbi:MAG: hypothetical protein WCY25_07935 [Moheibacter sp.]